MRKYAGFIAMLFIGLSTGIAPADAAKFSQRCSDGIGGAEVPIMVTPYTLGAEVQQVGATTYVRICFATSPVTHTGSQITGGQLEISIHPDGRVNVFCMGDGNSTVQPFCWANFVATPVTSGVGLHIFHITVDTTATDPVTLFGTGFQVHSVNDPGIPCVYVNYMHLVPICGSIV